MIELFGAIVYCVYSDKERILFRTSNEDFLYQSEAECCSETWIEDISFPELLINEEIVGVSKCEFPEKIDDSRENHVIKTYGWALKTFKGVCDIEFRNASNGYYGGSLELVKDKYEVVVNSNQDMLKRTVTIDGNILKLIA